MRRRFRFMAFDQAFGWPMIGPFIKYLGAFPVTLSGAGARKALREAVKWLREGAVLTVFPEGAREFADGKILPFKPGSVRIAIAAGVPILPVTIRGGNKIWPRGRKYPSLFRRVEIIYLPIVRIEEDPEPDPDELTERLREIIAKSF
jgi:1-acyl-sn-glycerol-3-phosphate acyltransferase